MDQQKVEENSSQDWEVVFTKENLVISNKNS
jgi:hypothetical protein